jgi:hypothetical protein
MISKPNGRPGTRVGPPQAKAANAHPEILLYLLGWLALALYGNP